MALNEKTLLNIYTSGMTDGIFTDLQNYDVPWKDLNINGALDLAYYGWHSGDKIISPLLEKIIDANNSEFTAAARANIAQMIYRVCGINWTKLYATLSLEYNPIENVDAYISETTQHTDNGTYTGNESTAQTGTDTESHTGTNENASSGTDIVNHTGTDTNSGSNSSDTITTGQIEGFNSSDFTNSDKTTENMSGTANNTETVNLADATEYGKKDTETRNLNDSITYGKTDTHTRDLADSHTGNDTHEVHRHGNIGVTTSQQMITAERELWQWFFYNVVFKDVDRFLTAKVY